MSGSPSPTIPQYLRRGPPRSTLSLHPVYSYRRHLHNKSWICIYSTNPRHPCVHACTTVIPRSLSSLPSTNTYNIYIYYIYTHTYIYGWNMPPRFDPVPSFSLSRCFPTTWFSAFLCHPSRFHSVIHTNHSRQFTIWQRKNLSPSCPFLPLYSNFRTTPNFEIPIIRKSDATCFFSSRAGDEQTCWFVSKYLEKNRSRNTLDSIVYSIVKRLKMSV